MAAIQTGSFNFMIGDFTFYIDKELLEMYPGVDAELVTIDYEYNNTNTEAGFCMEKNSFF